MHPLALFGVLVCSNQAWCCCTEGESLEQLWQPDLIELSGLLFAWAAAAGSSSASVQCSA